MYYVLAYERVFGRIAHVDEIMPPPSQRSLVQENGTEGERRER